MVCEKNETDLDIHIPAVLLPKAAGGGLHKLLMSGNAGNLLMHCGEVISISMFTFLAFLFA
jgi:signal peptide peptidase-like 2B